jgi:hypothetical protein
VQVAQTNFISTLQDILDTRTLQDILEISTLQDISDMPRTHSRTAAPNETRHTLPSVTYTTYRRQSQRYAGADSDGDDAAGTHASGRSRSRRTEPSLWFLLEEEGGGGIMRIRNRHVFAVIVTSCC